MDAIWLLPDDEVITPDNFTPSTPRQSETTCQHWQTLSLLVKAGALIGVTASYQSIGRQAAQVSSQILNGDKSMYGSVLQPDEAQVIVSVDTKEQIGLEINCPELCKQNSHQ